MAEQPKYTEFGDWTAGLVDEWAGTLDEPFDDVPAFDLDGADGEVSTAAHLEGDISHRRVASRRLFVDYRARPEAFKHIDPLPAAGESIHGVISGKYALWDLVPAIIEHGHRIDTLHLATLGFSKQNAAELLGFLDDGRVKSVALLVSYYFKKTSESIYESLVPELLKRKQRVLAMRTHCKIVLVKTTRRTSYVVESSANLRSCKNIEQFVFTRDARLYSFHRGWMDELLNGIACGRSDDRTEHAGDCQSSSVRETSKPRKVRYTAT